MRGTDFSYIRRNRLEREGLISSSGGADSERFLSPECVDFFVKCYIDLGCCSTIIVTWTRQWLEIMSSSLFEIAYRAGTWENVPPSMSVRVFTVPLVGGIATARGTRP